jgi:hypothetical protein
MPTINPGVSFGFGSDQLGRRSYAKTWHCETERRTVGPLQILQALFIQYGVQQGVHYVHYFSGHPDFEEDTGAFCTRIGLDMIPESLGQAWNITANYEPVDPQYLDFEDPTAIPIRVRWGGSRLQENVDRDIDDKPVVNSAGDPFMDPLVRDRSLEVLSIQRYEALYDPALAALYRDSINDADITILGRVFPARTVRVEKIEADLQWHNTFGPFWILDYEFLIDPRGWRVKVLDRGLNRIDTANAGKLIPITNKGVLITVPVLLDGSGQPLPEPLPSGTDPVFLSFKEYYERDFTVFNFPV